MKFRSKVLNSTLRCALAALLTVLLIAPSFSLPVMAADGTPIPQPLNLYITEDKSGGTPMLTAGTKALVRLPFIPSSYSMGGFITNLRGALTGSTVDPLQFKLSSAYQTINYLGFNNLGYFDYEIEVPITAAPGIHQMTLSLSYDATQFSYKEITDNEGKPITVPSQDNFPGQSASLTYYYNIVNPDYDTIVNGNPIRVVGSISPDSVKPGDVFSVGVKLQNDVAAPVSGIGVSVIPPTGFMLSGDTNSKTVSVDANGIVSVTFNMTATKELKSGEIQFTVKLSYTNPGGKSFSVDYNMIINAIGDDSEDADKNPAKIEITSISLPANAMAGDVFNAVVTLTNTSDKNAVIDELAVSNTLELPNRTSAVFSGVNLAAGERRSFEIKYYIPEKTTTAYTNFNVALKYTTEGGTIQKSTNITGGMMINSLATPSLSMALTTDKIVKAGNNFKITAIIKNGGGDASNLAIDLDLTLATGVKPKTQNKLKIEKLAAGASYTCTFELITTGDTPDGYSLIGVNLNCGDIAITQYTGTTIDNPKKTDTDNKDMPVIIIDSYDYGENVYAGKPFTLSMTFKNTSKTSAIKEMKMVIQSADTAGTFTPTNSSNTFFVDYLAAGASITKTIELSAKADSTAQSYPIDVIITFKNSAGTEGTSTEKITIPVLQELRFNKNPLPEIGTITISDTAYLSVSASNLGKGTIYNVRFKISGEGFGSTETEFFAGSINGGSQAQHEFELMPQQPGSATGTVTYTYEDSLGEVHTETQDFNFEIMDNTDVFNPMPVDPNMPIDPNTGMPIDPNMPSGEGEGGFFGFMKQNMWYFIGGGVILAVIIVAVVVVVIKRRNKKEEDDY